MKERLKIRIIIKSPALIGSGEGFGALIDSDVVFDDAGLPYIPAKRIKGCLRDSAKEVEEMLDEANMEIDAVFGKTGEKEPAIVFFSNLFIQEYEANQTWLHYFMEHDKFNKHITRESVQNHFTEIRQMTRIGEDGVASDHSLRSVRLIKKGEIFEGDVHITGSPDSNDPLIQTLKLVCMNFRRMGTNRNRGFGEISCTLDTGKRKFKMPEALCIS